MAFSKNEAAEGARVMKIDGRCHCGYVTFEAEADPETTTVCNCTDCQTMSGAPLRAVITTRPGTFALRRQRSGPPARVLPALRDRTLFDVGRRRFQGLQRPGRRHSSALRVGAAQAAVC